MNTNFSSYKINWKRTGSAFLSLVFCIGIFLPIAEAKNVSDNPLTTQDVYKETSGNATEIIEENPANQTANHVSQDISEKVYSETSGNAAAMPLATESDHEHEYEAIFNWSEDYRSCTATISCISCSKSENIACAIYSYSGISSYNDKDVIIYSAEVEYEGVEFWDEVEAAEVDFSWSEDYTSCVATISFLDVSKSEKIPCDVSFYSYGDEVGYSAEVEYEGIELRNSVEVAKAEFVWSEDYNSCKAHIQYLDKNSEDFGKSRTVDCTVSSYQEHYEIGTRAEVQVDGWTFWDDRVSLVISLKWEENYSSCQAVLRYLDENGDYTGKYETINCDVITIQTDSKIIFQAEGKYNGTPLYFYKSSDGDVSGNAYYNREDFQNTSSMITVLDDSTNGTASIATYYIDSEDDLILECSLPMEFFVSVEMDGTIVDPSNYTVVEGSTVLTFSSKYLDTLRPGIHTVTLNYNINGKSVDVSTNIRIITAPHGDNQNNDGNENVNTGNDVTGLEENYVGQNVIAHTGTNIAATNLSANNGFAPMSATVVDIYGNPLMGYTLEIHSDPVSATLDDSGRASFGNIQAGDHTLYLKDVEGNIVASKDIVIVFGDGYSIEGNVVYILEGRAFTLNVQYDGEEIILLSVEGDSPDTGDHKNFELWTLVMAASIVGLSIILTTHKNKLILRSKISAQ